MTMVDETIDEAVDTTPPDIEPPAPDDGEEWHGLSIIAMWTDTGDYVEISSCPELTEEQILRLIDRTVNSLIDMHRELTEDIGRRS